MADVNKDDVLWVKGNDSSALDENVWDDSELIKLYDRSVAYLKKEPNQSVSSVGEKEQTQRRKKKKSKNAINRWKVGQECLALYYEDVLYYEAIILSIDNDYKTVKVKFLYHGNEEDVNMKDILPMERKSEMDYYNSKHTDNNIVNNDVELKSCDNTNTSDNEKGDNKQTTIDWHVSDLCYVLNKKGVYQQAVVNSFISSDSCFVTFIKSSQKREVKLSQLHSSLPREYKRSREKSQSPPNHLNDPRVNDLPWPLPDFPMHIPPPPMLPGASGFPSLPSFNKNSSSWRHCFPNTTDNTFCGSNFPQCPQPPIIPDDVLAGNEEALANMLMSWYISGFHTGYYQGIQQKNAPPQRNIQNNQYRGGRKKNKRHHDKPKVSKV